MDLVFVPGNHMESALLACSCCVSHRPVVASPYRKRLRNLLLASETAWDGESQTLSVPRKSMTKEVSGEGFCTRRGTRNTNPRLSQTNPTPRLLVQLLVPPASI